MELTLALFTVIAIMSLLCEYMDASIGMGCRESLEHHREEREIAFPLALCVGALIGGIIGPWITYKINARKLRGIIAILAIITGIWCITKTFVF